MAQERISRKKLQEPDELLTASQQALAWVNQNQKRAGMIAGAVVVALLLVVGIKGYLERSRARRAAAVAEAVTKYTEAEGVPPVELRHEIAGLADRYQGSSEGAVARFVQAGALVAAGEKEQARRIYGDLAAGTSDFSLLSRTALAYLDLSEGASDQALTTFQELLKAEGTAVSRAQILMEIAAIHERQGRPAEARRAYEEIIAEHPDGPWTDPAKERLKLLPAGPPAS